MSTAEELDVPYRAAERRVDELLGAIRYTELCASHLTLEPDLRKLVTATEDVLRVRLREAATERNLAAQAVQAAWEAEQAAQKA